MADNVNITAGAGVVIATDQVGTDHYQRIKLTDGTADSSTGIYVDVGAKANALRIAPANDITDGTYIGDIKFAEGLAAGTNNIGDVDILTIAAGDNNIGNVDIVSLPASTNTIEVVGDVAENAVAAGNPVLVGGRYDVTPRTLGDTDAGAIALDADGAVHIADGGNTITVDGTVTANLSATDNAVLDTIDVVLDQIELNTDPLLVVGGGAEATAIRVTIANDSTGVITVDGTVTANLSATDNAVLDTIAGDTTSLDGKVTACNTGAVVISSGTVTTVSTVTNLSQLGGAAIAMNEGVLGTGVQRVTLATDDDGVAHLATIAGDTTNIETAIQIIDDWDATHASAAVVDGPQVMGAGYSAGLPTDVGADGDAARICTDRHGRILAGRMPQNFQATMTSADAQAATQVKAKTADRKMYILSLVVSTDTAMNIQFQDDTGPTVLIEQLYLAANGGAHLTWPPEAPLVVNTNEDFDVIASAAGNISVTITGYLAV